jgi:hypothetical protein
MNFTEKTGGIKYSGNNNELVNNLYMIVEKHKNNGHYAPVNNFGGETFDEISLNQQRCTIEIETCVHNYIVIF